MHNGTVRAVALGALGLAFVDPAAVGAQTPPAGDGKTHYIVAVGDSFGSGQGAPDKEANVWLMRFCPSWDNERCNRSRNAATRQAYDMLSADPELSTIPLTYESFACSGATIERGLLGPYRGSEPPPAGTPPLEPQIKEVDALARDPHNAIDALTITVGGNDILFEYIVAACLVGSCDLVHSLVEWRLFELDKRLKKMADAVAATAIAPDRVFVVEYPDPTYETMVTYCDGKPEKDPLKHISECEARWASECVLPRLNYQLCKIAQERGWYYVGSVADTFKGHGWCASDNWINTITESFKHQNHYRGGVHPNKDGYQAMGAAVAHAIKERLQRTGPAPTTCVEPPESPACTANCG